MKNYLIGKIVGDENISILSRDLKEKQFPYHCIGSDEIFEEKEVEIIFELDNLITLCQELNNDYSYQDQYSHKLYVKMEKAIKILKELK